LRQKYLWDMAHLCHIDALRVDALYCNDFFTYVLSIDNHYENLKKQRQQQGG